MHIPHGDPLLVHLMMLHEVKIQEVFEMGRFLFDIEGRHLQFGETEYILICGLKVGRYVDLLYDEKGRLHARLLPDISDARLRLKDLEDFIMSPKYLEVEDEDVVMLIQLVFVLKGLHGRDVKTCIPAAIYNLADNRDDWNKQLKEANPESKKIHKYTVPGFMLPFKIWILETFPEATNFNVCIPTELPRMRFWRSKAPLSWDNYCRIINMFVPNNQPIQVVANETELMLPFYVRYVNWTLNHEESPPLQQSPPPQHSPVRNSPPAIQSPPRRIGYMFD
uniref:Uncharacterized protein n=1 Tax=Lactuca sativa TaxID=4236 RepID=A0A9R1W6A3_LACSA|nr:hypothetical protein LSAT_V11C300145120 [Lactuca sativa]